MTSPQHKNKKEGIGTKAVIVTLAWIICFFVIVPLLAGMVLEVKPDLGSAFALTYSLFFLVMIVVEADARQFWGLLSLLALVFFLVGGVLYQVFV